MAKILVVEDEPELREIITLELNDVGHRTCEAGNGEEALQQAVDYKPEIIVSDITMPVMNGYQFFRTLREKHPEMSHTPFIFLSALADKNDVLKGYRLGVDDYISKPIDFELLIARIDARLSLAAARSTPSAGRDSVVDEGPAADGHSVADATGQDDAPMPEEEEAASAQNPDTLVAAKLQTVSLEKIRKRCGDRWKDVRERILRIAQQVITEHLAQGDVFDQLESGDFIITFINPKSEVASQKIQIIKDELWERLFGETNDESLSSVRSEVHEIEVKQEERTPFKVFMGHVFEKIKAAGSSLSQASEEKIRGIFRNEELVASEILSSSIKKNNITKVDFSHKTNNQIDKILDHEDFDLAFLSELNDIFLERAFDKIKANIQSLIVFPMRFSMTVADNRRSIEKFFKSLDETLQARILIERIGLPNRLRTVGDEMKPLSFGRKIQIAELRSPSQLIDFDLRKCRVGIMSMSYEDVVYQHAKGAKEMIDDFRGHGGHFYIKDVPKRKTETAKGYGADLISLKV